MFFGPSVLVNTDDDVTQKILNFINVPLPQLITSSLTGNTTLSTLEHQGTYYKLHAYKSDRIIPISYWNQLLQVFAHCIEVSSSMIDDASPYSMSGR